MFCRKDVLRAKKAQVPLSKIRGFEEFQEDIKKYNGDFREVLNSMRDTIAAIRPHKNMTKTNYYRNGVTELVRIF